MDFLLEDFPIPPKAENQDFLLTSFLPHDKQPISIQGISFASQASLRKAYLT